MPKSAWKAKRTVARTNRRQAKRQAARKAARRGFQEQPRSQRRRGAQTPAFLLGLLFARDLFDTLSSTAKRPLKFEAASYRQTPRNRKAA